MIRFQLRGRKYRLIYFYRFNVRLAEEIEKVFILVNTFWNEKNSEELAIHLQTFVDLATISAVQNRM